MGYICGDIVHKNEVIGVAGVVRGVSCKTDCLHHMIPTVLDIGSLISVRSESSDRGSGIEGNWGKPSPLVRWIRITCCVVV